MSTDSIRVISKRFGKHPAYFRRHTGVGKVIQDLYGDVTIDTVEAYDNRCDYLVSLVHRCIASEVISKEELAKAVYGPSGHIGNLTHGLFRKREVRYTPYSFLQKDTLANYILAEEYILTKYNAFKRIFND